MALAARPIPSSVPSPARRLSLVAAFLLFGSAAPVIAACGADQGAEGSAQGSPLSLSQSARSGSFLGSGEELELVLRGVGGATSLGVEASGGGGAAGALPTAKLPRLAGRLLGPEPYAATLAGAEVGPQRYSLELRDPRYDGVLGAIRYRAEVVGGAPERPPGSFGAATLTLGSSLPAQTLSGEVTNSAGGAPLGGALITVELSGSGLITMLSDADGSFRAAPLPAGSYRLSAALAGYEPAAADTTLPGAPASLELEPIEGEVAGG